MFRFGRVSGTSSIHVYSSCRSSSSIAPASRPCNQHRVGGRDCGLRWAVSRPAAAGNGRPTLAKPGSGRASRADCRLGCAACWIGTSPIFWDGDWRFRAEAEGGARQAAQGGSAQPVCRLGTSRFEYRPRTAPLARVCGVNMGGARAGEHGTSSARGGRGVGEPTGADRGRRSGVSCGGRRCRSGSTWSTGGGAG